MDMIQSFIYSTGRAKLSVYEQRVMMAIVKHAQSTVRGMVIKDHLEPWQHEFDNVFFNLKIKELLSDGSQHYEYIIKAVRSLSKRTVEFVSADGHDYFISSIVYNVKVTRGSGCVSFYVARNVFDVILDFSKGYRKYDLEVALKITSPFAARMYVLMNGQRRPLQYSIAELKRMFGVYDKYSQTRDFIAKVIDSAKAHLDGLGCNSFRYERLRVGTKVIGLRFYAEVREDDTKKTQLAKTNVSFVMSKEIKLLLMQWANFKLKELGAHKQMLEDFCQIPGCYQVLTEIVNRAKSRGKEKGYIIAAMRSEVDDFANRQAATKTLPLEKS